MHNKSVDTQYHPNRIYALFGGTFDPIHYGHLRSVEALAAQIGLQQVILLPNNVPPHRPQPKANALQRLQMVELAVANNPLLTVDAHELQYNTPSYIIDTLEAIRHEQGEELSLVFIIGQDSLLSLHTWHRWQSMLDVCHLVVCARPGYSHKLRTFKLLKKWLDKHRVDDAQKLNQQPSGYIYQANTPLLDISSTYIRRHLRAGKNCDDLLPRAVQQYIELHNLYR